MPAHSISLCRPRAQNKFNLWHEKLHCGKKAKILGKIRVNTQLFTPSHQPLRRGDPPAPRQGIPSLRDIKRESQVCKAEYFLPDHLVAQMLYQHRHAHAPRAR